MIQRGEHGDRAREQGARGEQHVVELSKIEEKTLLQRGKDASTYTRETDTASRERGGGMVG
jgi:hypothetical protein